MNNRVVFIILIASMIFIAMAHSQSISIYSSNGVNTETGSGFPSDYSFGGGSEPSSGGAYGNGYEPSSDISMSTEATYTTGSNGQPISGRGPTVIGNKKEPARMSHPSIEPNEGIMPSNPPSASSECGVPYLYHGENPSLEDLRKVGGDISSEQGLQYYTLYNSLWSQCSTAYWYNQRTNTVYFIDRPQYVESYEKYPDGQVVWNDLGNLGKGYHTGWFSADERGWHRLAIWGSQSGWSNVLWIYVW